MRLRLRLRLRLRVRVRVRVKVRPPVEAHLAQELCGSSGGRCTAPSQEVEDVAEVRALSKARLKRKTSTALQCAARLETCT